MDYQCIPETYPNREINTGEMNLDCLHARALMLVGNLVRTQRRIGTILARLKERELTLLHVHDTGTKLKPLGTLGHFTGRNRSRGRLRYLSSDLLVQYISRAGPNTRHRGEVDQQS